MSNTYKKEMDRLVKSVRKFGRKVCDGGSYEERQSKHLLIKFFVDGNVFRRSFATSPSSFNTVRDTYKDVRNQLQKLGLSDPRFSVRLITGLSGNDDLLGHIYSVMDDMDKLQKPYAIKIKYQRDGQSITYDRTYVWGTRFRRDDTKMEGFFALPKSR